MSDFYNSYWNIYKERTAYQGKIAKCMGEYFQKNHPNKSAGEIKSILSVGHGEGDIDVPLLRDYLTGVTQYYGVDVRKSASDMMQKKLSELSGRTFQTQLTNDYIQKYDGPPGPVDVIIVGHVMYYMIDEFVAVVDKLKTWLSPGGCIVLSHVDPVNFHFKTDKIAKGKGINFTRFVEERDNCKDKLKTEGWTVEDHYIAHAIDMSGTSSEVLLLIKLLRDIDPTAEEMKEIEVVIEEESIQGTKKIPYNYEISMIYKK